MTYLLGGATAILILVLLTSAGGLVGWAIGRHREGRLQLRAAWQALRGKNDDPDGAQRNSSRVM